MLKEIAHKDLNDVLKMLKEALNAVENIYIEQYYFRLRGGQIQKPERAFVAELYHQLRMQQLEMRADNILRDLVFHCDISKINYILNNECVKDVSNYRLMPDLVLHKSQSDNNPENQLLVCEVKMDSKISKDNFKKDLDKLLYYKISQLKFQNAVFVFTGTKETIETLLGRYSNSEGNNSLLNCLCEHEIVFALKDKEKNNKYNWELYKVSCSDSKSNQIKK